MARFEIDPEDAPWWTFFVILAICLAFAALIMGAMTLLGDSPARGPAWLAAITAAAGLGVVVRWLFGKDVGRRPPTPPADPR